MREPFFDERDEPFTLAEIAQTLGVDYEDVRNTIRSLRRKPELRNKVIPLGHSHQGEYSAKVANFIARRCPKVKKYRNFTVALPMP